MNCPICFKAMLQLDPEHWICSGCHIGIEQMNIEDVVVDDPLNRWTKFKIHDICPMGAVRTTQRQKYSDIAAQRYAQYKMIIGLAVKQQLNGSTPTKAACAVDIRFIMPLPGSWSGKKKREMAGKPHVSKPDIDNLIKGVFDAVNKLVWMDDNQVIAVNASKVYEDPSHKTGIEFDVTELF